MLIFVGPMSKGSGLRASCSKAPCRPYPWFVALAISVLVHVIGGCDGSVQRFEAHLADAGGSGPEQDAGGPCTENCGTAGQWWADRDTQGRLRAESGTTGFGLVTFDYERSNEIVERPPVGHNLPDRVVNRLFYNLLIDGYQGLPPGSCLERSEFMDSSDPTKPICARTENDDLLRNWAQGDGSGFQNVLFKNVTSINAIRTINHGPGSSLPHTDTFQTYYPGDASEAATAAWLVIQDTEIRNSDNSMMISSSGPHRGVVYQNLRSGFCDRWFYDDGRARVENDFANHGAVYDGPVHSCTNSMTASLRQEGQIWLINVESSGAVFANPRGGQVVVVGDEERSLNFRNDVEPFDLCHYSHIEDALADSDASDGCGNFEKPPFLEFSCAGWATPPTGCQADRGFIGLP